MSCQSFLSSDVSAALFDLPRSRTRWTPKSADSFWWHRPPDPRMGVVPRFKLTIEYAGTRYSGWQIQKNAKTIQGEIDRAVRTVTGRKDFELYGSGRTDAGVHALGQVAHLDVSTSLAAEPLRRRLNDELPADINILASAQVPHRFHARHHAAARRYLYQIARRRPAFPRATVWR